MEAAPLILYILLFLGAALAPLRLSVLSFLLLSNIDLGSTNASIGALNTAKAMILPVFMLWRFRAYRGHGKLGPAPILWSLLIVYVAIASLWSLYPSFAIKLIGHLIGSLLICMLLLRASKGGFLNMRTIVPVTIGVLAMALFHWKYVHNWGGEIERFSTFSGAQAFAAFIVALYSATVCARQIRPAIRIPLALALGGAVLINGSRLWILGLACSTLLAVFVSRLKPSAKLFTFGACFLVLAVGLIEFDDLMVFVAQRAHTNRIAAAVSAAYEGDIKSSGLGTYNLRHELFRRSVDAIKSGTPSEIVFGHGTCNGAQIAETLNKNPDPNRAMHNEWLRALYEWGLIGLSLWLLFIGSLVMFAIRGARLDPRGYSYPLLIYLPAFVLGLSGENIIAGAGNAVSVGLLMLIGLAGISYRQRYRSVFAKTSYLSGAYVPYLRDLLPSGAAPRFHPGRGSRP